LEANYDEEMLAKGNYPFHLKKRISGGMGHLSNKEALALFLTHKPHFMSHLLLSHLSKNNNSAELVEEIFNAHAGNVKITIASRDCETEVFQIHSKYVFDDDSKLPHYKKPLATQLSFGFA
jgi:phosphoribosyl 1,2-cyclic phosphodiesterase